MGNGCGAGWRKTDVLVIGAGASGIPAAIGAARAGAEVILLEEDALPGGAAVDQYVLMPDGGPRVGVCAELVEVLQTRYALTSRPVDRWYYYWYLPSDYLAVVAHLLRAEKQISLACGVTGIRPVVEGGRVVGAVHPTVHGTEVRIEAAVTIDATGTGQFAADAGAACLYGRDSCDDFGEAPAPPARDGQVQLCTWQYLSHRLEGAAPFDFRRLEQCRSGLKSGLHGIALDEVAASPKDPSLYLHWGCRVRCPDTRDPEALATTQNEALAAMAGDLALLREHGYAVHLAPRIGVRESRRVRGEAVVDFNQLVAGVIPQDSVFITDRDADIWAEGKEQMDYPATGVYGIPYGALIPKGLDGLYVVGKSMSGTHLAMSAYRVQCILAGIGQASGVAAALSSRRGGAVRDLSVSHLHREMEAPEQHMSLDAMKKQIEEKE